MKKFLLIVFVMVMIITGCAKKQTGCTPVSPQSEEPQIIAYATSNGITAVKHSSGIYYQIINPGSGVTPTASSTVYVTYVGKLLNGTGFDSSKVSVPIDLTGVIEGWQIGIPLIKKGGEIKLIIPSSYAYGCNGFGAKVPPNSILYFDVGLIDVK